MRYFFVLISIGIFSFFLSQNLWAVQEKALSFRMVQLPPSQVNFAFDKFSTFWSLSEESFKKFYSENSRIEDVEVPKLPIDWKTEASMMIFWKSEDNIIRFPSLSGSTVRSSDDEAKQPILELEFTLTTPCFGIITDASPSYLLIFPYTDLKYSKIKINTINAKQTNCIETKETKDEEKDPQETES